MMVKFLPGEEFLPGWEPLLQTKEKKLTNVNDNDLDGKSCLKKIKSTFSHKNKRADATKMCSKLLNV